jgi:hypothetical protein
MFEPHDKNGAPKDGAADTAEPRRVVQSLSVIRANRVRQSSPEQQAVNPTGPTVPASPLITEPQPQVAPPQPQQRQGSGVPQSTLLYLWTLLNQRPWSSLVVVPAHAGGSGRQTAEAILEVGTAHRSSPIHLLDAEGLPLGAASAVVREMMAYVQQGDRVVVTLDSVIANPVGLEVALAAQRALLCVSLGTTDFASARRTIDMIGKERFAGSVTLSPSGAPKK